VTHRVRTITPGIVLLVVLVVVVMPFLPLLISQQWRWVEAWAFGLTFSVGFVLSRLLVARTHPDLLTERARGLRQDDAEPWDITLAPIVGLGFGAIALVAGLDARYGWSGDFSTIAKLLALAIILIGYALGTYAMYVNRFFSGMVRIQTDRGHEVVSRGPYRWVRHPGYVGALMTYLASPILLDAAWALVPAIAVGIALVVRTKLEDETLVAKLDGYREYAQRTRYRLLPGVW